jgi:hypothetical protein
MLSRLVVSGGDDIGISTGALGMSTGAVAVGAPGDKLGAAVIVAAVAEIAGGPRTGRSCEGSRENTRLVEGARRSSFCAGAVVTITYA